MTATATRAKAAVPQDVALRRAARVALYRRRFDVFAAEQLKIATKSATVEPFTLRPFQLRLFQAMDAQATRTGMVRQLWLKSRQIGTSTLAAGLSFHRTILWPNVNAIVVAHDDGTAQTLFQKTHLFYDRLEGWLKPMKRYSTRAELYFANPQDKDRDSVPGLNSRLVIASARNIHSAAGSTLHFCHLSEAARYPKAEEIAASTLQTVPMLPGTAVIIESTARPEGDWFRLQYEAAVAGKSLFEANFIGWNEDPTCVMPLLPGETLELDEEEQYLVREFGLTLENLKFRRAKLDSDFSGDADIFRQEYPLTPEECFSLRGYGVFPIAHLRKLQPALAPPRFRATPMVVNGRPLLAKDAVGPLAVWDEPEEGAEYDIGADVALGLDDESSDWSTAQVLKRPHGIQVAEYRAKIEPGEFADVLATIGRCYNTAQINVEVTGPGYYTNARLCDIYPNVYIDRAWDKIRRQISNYTGFKTSLVSKATRLVPLAKDRIYRYVASTAPERYPLIRSRELWRELSIYVQVPGKDEFHAAPGRGNHDDLVMAWALAVVAGHDQYSLTLETPRAAAAAPVGGPIERSMTAEEAAMPGARSRSWFGVELEGWAA